MSNSYSTYGLVNSPGAFDYLHNRNIDGSVYNPQETEVNPNLLPWWDNVDVIIGDHINTLQDGMSAMQMVMGINPQIDKNSVDKLTVGARITALETTVETQGSDFTSAVKNHKHDGATNSPSKINLGTEVQEKLGKANIDLTLLTGLTASDILVTAGKSVAAVLAEKVSAVGGAINGNINISGNLSANNVATHSRFEADGTMITVDAGGEIGSVKTVCGNIWSSSFAQSPATPGTGTQLLCHITPSLRYGKYCFIFMVGVAFAAGYSPTSFLNTEIFSITVKNTSSATAKTISIKGSDLNDSYFIGTVRPFYLTADIGLGTGDIGISVECRVQYTASAGYRIVCDGISAEPSHTAVIA